MEYKLEGKCYREGNMTVVSTSCGEAAWSRSSNVDDSLKAKWKRLDDLQRLLDGVVWIVWNGFFPDNIAGRAIFAYHVISAVFILSNGAADLFCS